MGVRFSRYWQVGRRIRGEILGSRRAAYREQIVSTLSRQLRDGLPDIHNPGCRKVPIAPRPKLQAVRCGCPTTILDQTLAFRLAMADRRGKLKLKGMIAMTIRLSKDQERFIHEAVRAGLYASEDAVVSDALERLKQTMPKPGKKLRAQSRPLRKSRSRPTSSIGGCSRLASSASFPTPPWTLTMMMSPPS